MVCVSILCKIYFFLIYASIWKKNSKKVLRYCIYGFFLLSLWVFSDILIMGKSSKKDMGNDLLFMVYIIVVMLIIGVSSYLMNDIITNMFNITFE